jgi:hypothetical protein
MGIDHTHALFDSNCIKAFFLYRIKAGKRVQESDPAADADPHKALRQADSGGGCGMWGRTGKLYKGEPLHS